MNCILQTNKELINKYNYLYYYSFNIYIYLCIYLINQFQCFCNSIWKLGHALLLKLNKVMFA